MRKAKKSLSGKAASTSKSAGGDPQPPSVRRRGSALARFDNYEFDPLLPRVAKISKKKPGELNELDLHRIAAANSVVRYAESRSAVYEPSNFEPSGVALNVPPSTLTLEHVHGFSGKVSTNTNVLYLKSGECVFPASAAVVIMDTDTNTQRFFLEHDDDVMALAVHPKLDIVASGQLSRKAFVLVYDVTLSNPEGITFINELSLGNNTRGVKALDFSPDGEMLLSIACDPYHTVTIWDWKKNLKLASARANNAEVVSMRWSPFTCYHNDMVAPHECEYTLCSLGSRHIKFWTLEPDDSVITEGAKDEKEAKALAQRLGKWSLDSNAASFGNKAKMQDVNCATFILDNVADLPNEIAPSSRTICGTESGSIFVFSTIEEPRHDDSDDPFGAPKAINQEEDEDDMGVKKPVKWAARGALINVIKDAHTNGPVTDISAAGATNIVASVGRDGLLKIWQLSTVDEGDELTLKKSINITTAGVMLGYPRSVIWSRDLTKVIVGTTGNCIVECRVGGLENVMGGGQIGKINILSMECVVKSHANSVRMCASHPSEPMYGTVGDDRSFNLWSSEENRIIASLKMPDKIYSVAFHPDGEFVALGLENGDVYVKRIPDSEDGSWEHIIMKKTGNKIKKAEGGAWQARQRPHTNPVSENEEDEGPKKRNKKKDIKHSVTKLAFSPDGRTLVAACRDYFLYVFDVTVQYKKVAVMKGHSTFVTHMDFSEDGRVLQSNDAAREILYWDVRKGRQLANSFDLRDTSWHTWSCVFGWSVQGIWEENTGGEQNVLSVARSNNGHVVATGDDNNMINLFRYPALKGVSCKAFGGHMSPVVSLIFSNDDTKLFSSGGTDCSVFQWKYH